MHRVEDRAIEESFDDRIYIAAGMSGAIVLGMALSPLRELTSAANLSFPFMALTIAVAEYGGRRAAVATALVSALSLDFFLTQPYLRLTIADKHDIIAFAGLAICGLIAAAFGSGRGGRIASAVASRRHLALLHDALREVEDVGPVGPAIGRILESSLAALPLAAAAVRNARGEIVASSGRARELPVPAVVLRPDAVPATHLPIGAPFPTEGARLALTIGNRLLGWLDVWGTGERTSAETRRTLADLGRVVCSMLARGTSSSEGSR